MSWYKSEMKTDKSTFLKKILGLRVIKLLCPSSMKFLNAPMSIFALSEE